MYPCSSCAHKHNLAPPLHSFLQPPRPPELFGLGHSLSMTSALASGVPFESLILKWRREYGPCFEFRLPGNPPVVLVSDPEAIKEVGWQLTWGYSQVEQRQGWVCS